jgi:hypothetical protein
LINQSTNQSIAQEIVPDDEKGPDDMVAVFLFGSAFGVPGVGTGTG